MTSPVHVVTTTRRRSPRRFRGLLAVARLLGSAADDLASALCGWAPLRTTARALATVITAAYRRGAWAPRPPVNAITVRPEEGTPPDGDRE